MSRFALIAAALCAVVTSGCKKDDDSGSGGNATLLRVTRSATAIVADGVSTVGIHVEGGTASPITVTTTRGHFGAGQTTTTIVGMEGDVILHSCLASAGNCLGSALVSAHDAGAGVGSTTVLFTSSEICDNDVDDDQDGETDCADTSCPASVQCNAVLGLVCASDRTCSVCAGGGGTAEPGAELSCADGFDNDCDGVRDCADSDCAAQTCATATTVGTCQSGACVCEKTENVEASCSNGLDDDCDGLADCLDSSCLGKICDDAGRACGGSPVSCSVCTSGQITELAAQCQDGRDNDCDGVADCEDSDCLGQACSQFGGVCAVQSGIPVCACASGQAAEFVCNDGVDDDCNGLTDCADPNCDAQVCGATAASVCEGGECVDSATKYSVKLTPTRTRLPALDGAQTVVTLKVTFEGKPSQGTTVDLSVPALLGTTLPASVTTNAAGEAKFTFVASGVVGVAEVVGQIHGIPTTGKTSVEMPALGTIKVASIQYPVMGVKHSGYQESNNLAVQLLDLEQTPYPAGLPVQFRHFTLGGSTVTLPHTPDDPGACELPWCVGYDTATDEEGIARVSLFAGTVAGTVSIDVTAAAGGQPARAFDIPAIAIIGAKASGAHLSVVCTPENIPAFASTTCSTSLVDSPFHCTAILKDRFNNILGRATTVTFMSEAGAVGPPATTPAYNATKPPEDQGNLGLAIEIINTLGNKLPKDVPAHQGAAHPYGAALNLAYGDPRWEYALAYDDLLCDPAQVHNPRDGVVTVIASTPGEEAFFDSNGNGVYDPPGGATPGEPFVDLPEPFVDYDDDNTRDADEPFIDSNSDGQWNAVNGVWDASTKIWTQTVVVYTGLPQQRRVGGQEYLSRWMTAADLDDFPLPTPAPTLVLQAWNSTDGYDHEDAWAVATDGNLNWLSSSTEYAVYSGYSDTTIGGYLGLDEVPDTKGFSYVYWPCDAADPSSCANDCGAANDPPPERCVMRSVLRGYRHGYVARSRFEGSTVNQNFLYLWHVNQLGFALDVPLTGSVVGAP